MAAYAVTMSGTGAPWTLAELESVLDELSEHYDDWHLAGIGGSLSDDGVPKGSAWIEPGTEPDPRLVSWIARLEHPDMIELREVGVALPGEGPWVDTPEDMRGVGL